MATRLKWQYDEMKHCGVDYSNQAGFEIETSNYNDGFLASYLCTKKDYKEI